MGKGDKRGKHRPAPAGCELKPVNAPARAKAARGPGRPPVQREALDERCVRFGIPPSDGARVAMKAQWAGDPLGMVLMRQCANEEKVARLWRCWMAITAAADTYRKRIIGLSGNPANSALPMMAEQMAADQSHSVDLRSQDERDSDARANWARWQRHMAQVDRQHVDTLDAMLNGNARALWHQRAPTWHGIEAHAAVAALADVAEG